MQWMFKMVAMSDLLMSTKCVFDGDGDDVLDGDSGDVFSDDSDDLYNDNDNSSEEYETDDAQ